MEKSLAEKINDVLIRNLHQNILDLSEVITLADSDPTKSFNSSACKASLSNSLRILDERMQAKQEAAGTKDPHE